MCSSILIDILKEKAEDLYYEIKRKKRELDEIQKEIDTLEKEKCKRCNNPDCKEGFY